MKTWAPRLRRSDKHSPIHSPMSQPPSPAFMSGSITDAQKVELLLERTRPAEETKVYMHDFNVV